MAFIKIFIIMKKSLFILITFLLIGSLYANVNVVAPVLKASEVFIPIGNSGQKISLQELSEINMKDLQKLTGKKMSFFEKMGAKAGQRKLKQHIHADGTLDNGFVKKLESKRGLFGVFNLGGFALGLFLSLLGVLIAYLITTGDKKGRIRWAWIGAIISFIIWGAILI